MASPRAKPHRRVRDPGPVRPYLGGALRAAFDAWLDAAVARHTTQLAFREIRKGAQALSWLYVERRGDADLGARSLEGHGKRAALATYYAPLHFLTAHHALAQIGVAPGALRRVVDLGAGTGASGAAVALALGAREVVAIDRSGFALSEARRTLTAFGLLATTRRGRIPDALPKPEPGDAWVFGWSVNEMSDRERALLLPRIEHAIGRGVALVLFEPLAGSAVPWWRAWRDALAPLGVADHECKVRVALPEWIARLDCATALDHRVLGARALVKA
jgi:SAM-dependent methyltransferase